MRRMIPTALLIVAALAASALAAEPCEVRQIRTANFLLHTDLSLDDAQPYLARMERTIDFAADYWRRSPHAPIECYLIHDLENWPESALPDRLARVIVGGIGGVTVTRPRGHRDSGRALVYASSKRGVIEHEVLHAYCAQNFGALGPEWYKEGMAEMAAFGEIHEAGVRCPSERLAMLRAMPLRSNRQIRQNSPAVTRMSRSLQKLHVAHGSRPGQVPLENWTAKDVESVQLLRDDYLWSWSLCHFLHHNPNYRDRFRMLGESYVTQPKDRFEQIFAPMANELCFEYEQFIRHIETGYRVDLCRWDWHCTFVPLRPGKIVTVRCEAARGWQPAEVWVTHGTPYAFRVRGEWSTEAEGELYAPGARLPAAAPNGRGRLQAVVLDGFRLGEPFYLNAAQGTFVAPATGKLYLRCEDAWHELADNRGHVEVKFARSAISDEPVVAEAPRVVPTRSPAP